MFWWSIKTFACIGYEDIGCIVAQMLVLCSATNYARQPNQNSVWWGMMFARAKRMGCHNINISN